MLYMVTFTINLPQMLAYIPYLDPMGYIGNFIIPTDKLIFFRGVGQLPAAVYDGFQPSVQDFASHSN